MPFPALPPTLLAALTERGYAEPTPVQAAVLEAPTAGRDLLVSAQTGSGKTVAFGLAMAAELITEGERLPPAGAPLALVVAPTRELALQVQAELTWLYAPAGGRVVSAVGGTDPIAERRALARGAHIVAGTPGRLRDHLERGNIDPKSIRAVILDEADEMLDMGFKEELEAILETTPAERRTLLFSATLARDIVQLAKSYQNDALRIDTLGRNEPHRDIEYRAVRVAPNETEHAIVNLLRYFESPGALVFCNTRESVRALHSKLRERGFAVVGLSGELSQRERADALQALRDGHARACVATDVAARGLDLPDLGLVIHADLPANTAALLHRSGRTGRAGRKGVSVLLAPYPKRRIVERLLASANIEAEWSGPPSPDEIRARDQARLLEDPLLNEAPSPEDLVLAQRILADRSPEQVAAALIRLHRARLPEPEEVFDDVRDRGPDTRPQEPRPPRHRASEDPAAGHGGGAWFRLGVGRTNNADPKWLVPLICRLGHVTKKDIGEIRIFDRETKFEIATEAEPRFREAIKAASQGGDMRVQPAGAPGPRPPRSGGGAAPDRGPRSVPKRPAGPGPRPGGYDPTRSEPPPKQRKPKPKRKSNG